MTIQGERLALLKADSVDGGGRDRPNGVRARRPASWRCINQWPASSEEDKRLRTLAGPASGNPRRPMGIVAGGFREGSEISCAASGLAGTWEETNIRTAGQANEDTTGFAYGDRLAGRFLLGEKLETD